MSAELKLHPEVSGLLRELALAALPVLIAFLTRILMPKGSAAAR